MSSTPSVQWEFPERPVLIGAFIGFAVLTLVTVLLAPAVQAKFYPLPEDTGAEFYQWQTVDPPAIVRVSYWLGYALHQIFVWVIFLAGRRYEPTAGKVNRYHLWMLGGNLLFTGLHLVQTYLWFDGLAQDVPVWTSQGSVIVLLVLVLYLNIPKRGLIWGKRFDPPQKMLGLIRKLHGPYIAWALVYTFWFHPMDGNWGLISGFVYMFLLFIQMSLFNTKQHKKQRWIVVLEVFVAVHGTLVTIYKGNEIWPMFLFGFLTMFVLTQFHAYQPPVWLKWTVLFVFLAAIAGVYVAIRGVERLYEISFIPVALYGGVLALLGIGAVWDRLSALRRSRLNLP